MGVEFFVSSLENVEFGVVERGINVHVAVTLPEESTHARSAFGRELAVKDDDDAFVWAGGCDGRLEEKVIHLFLLVQIQSSLREERQRQLLNLYSRGIRVETGNL